MQSFGSVSNTDISKLIKIIEQRNAINTLSPSRRAEFDKVMVMLDTLADEMCQLLKSHLNGQYKSFTCVEEDLRDLQQRMQYQAMVYRLYREIPTDLDSDHPRR